MGVEIGPGGLIEASRSVRVERVFRWLGRRMFRKDFHAVRGAPGSIDALREAAAAGGPLVVLGNHVSWWDPMLAVLITDLLMPGRSMVAAMDTDELVRFGVFRRLGVFGIRPKDPDALEPMVRYLERVFTDDPRSVFWVTPQGEFADVRAKLRLRPGTAAVLSRLEHAGTPVRAVSMAVEYGFGVERKPELYFRVTPVDSPEPRDAAAGASTTDWLRAMTRDLGDNMGELAKLVMRRDAHAFETLMGGAGGDVNPFYSFWQKLRGQKRSLGSGHEAPPVRG